MMKENFSHFTERKPLFPGESCQLLSPNYAVNDQELLEYSQNLENDQLGKIFKVIGTPKTEEDLSFIIKPEAQKYVKCFQQCEKVNLKDEMYPAVDDRGIALLNKMLEFNPDKRISAEEALKDAYFDEIRLEDQEQFEPCEIDLSFIDKEGELSNEQLKEIIIEKIDDLSSNTADDIARFIDQNYNSD